MTGKCVVLVAEPGPLRDATRDLLRTLPGVDIHCAENLSVARQTCRASKRHHLLSLVLVELQRCNGNGFSLAATLSRELPCPVALLSDRNDQADHHWSKSRGIAFCWSRIRGRQIFLETIGKTLNVENEQTGNTTPGFSGSRMTLGLETKPKRPEFVSKWKQKALVFRRARERLAETLSESQLGLIEEGNGSGSNTRDKGVLLASHNVAAMSFAVGLLDRELVEFVSVKQPLQRWKCLQVLKYPIMAINHPARHLRRGCQPILAWQACEVIRGELLAGLSRLHDGGKCSDRHRVRQHLLSIAVSVQALNPQQLPLRWINQLPALLVHLAASQHALLEEGNDQWLWFAQRFAVGQCIRYGDDTAKVFRRVHDSTINVDDSLPGAGDDLWQSLLKRPGTKLCCERLDLLLRRIAASDSLKTAELDQQTACINEALYQLMVCTQLSAKDQQAIQQYVGENLLLRSLYQSSRNLVWHERKEREEYYWQLVELLKLLRSGGAGLLMRCLGLEVRLSRAVRSKAMQHRLSGGLHMLPRPDLISSSLMHETLGSTTLISDLQVELNRLITGAERLGVTWVGALAYALLQALQIASGDRFLATRRRLVVRGLYRLCRMLDQAAAWQTVSAASGSINRLLQLRFSPNDNPGRQQGQGQKSLALTQVAELGPVKYSQTADIKDKYQQCKQLNQLIGMVLKEQKMQSGAAATLGRLINEQARLLQDAFSS